MVTTCCQSGALLSDIHENVLFDNPCSAYKCPCQLSPPINEYTYCVLKKVCRKILKEICQEQRREVYTIFDGGSSMKYEAITKGAPGRRGSSIDSLQRQSRQQRIKRLCGSDFDMKNKKGKKKRGDHDGGSDDSNFRRRRSDKRRGSRARDKLGQDKSGRDRGYSGQDKSGRRKSELEKGKSKKGKENADDDKTKDGKSKSKKGKSAGRDRDSAAELKTKEEAARLKAEKDKAEARARAEKEKADARNRERDKKRISIDQSDAKLRADREKAGREKADREKAGREKADREKADREKADREKADREKADKEKAKRKGASETQVDVDKKRKNEINDTIQSRLLEQQRRCSQGRGGNRNRILMGNRLDIDRDFAKRQRIGSCGTIDPPICRYEFPCPPRNMVRPCFDRPRNCYTRVDAIRTCDYLRAHMEYRDMCCPRSEPRQNSYAPCVSRPTECPRDPCNVRCPC